MVVGDVATVFEREELTIAELTGKLPDEVDNGCSHLHADTFSREGCTAAANHVEQDAIAGFVSVGTGALCPELRTEAPGVARAKTVLCPLRSAQILGIEANHVDACLYRVLLQQTTYLQHDGHAAGSIVGRKDGRVVVGLVGVVIGPGTRVPMCTQQDAVRVAGIDAGYDVAGRQLGAVPGGHGGRLLLHFCTQ